MDRAAARPEAVEQHGGETGFVERPGVGHQALAHLRGQAGAAVQQQDGGLRWVTGLAVGNLDTVNRFTAVFDSGEVFRRFLRGGRCR